MGVALVVLLVGIAVIGPLVAPHSPSEFVGAPYSKPSAVAKLGTDSLGRDVLSRVIYGARISLVVGVVSVIMGLSMGGTIGALAGAFGVHFGA